MKTVLLIPLDERPCNYDFPRMLAQQTGCRLLMPPREILGKKKQPGDTAAIRRWLFDHAAECDSAILSIDAYLYSGIVPSRLHHFSSQELTARLEELRRLRSLNPKLEISAFSLIMRNPTYSSSEEEPDYYARWGREIHLSGVYRHKMELGIATDEEKTDLARIETELPKDVEDDYLGRRHVNLEINKAVVKLAVDGVFDFVVIPQDDASPYGLTAKDQQEIRDMIEENDLNLNVYMYPDADAVADILLARAINRMEGRRPLVYVKYASTAGSSVIPSYEDRQVGETIKYQILAGGGLVASSAPEAQIILLVNVPGGQMQDMLQEAKNGRVLQRTLSYDAFRTLPELVEYGDYAVNTLQKSVIFADIAYPNGGDPLLFRMLRKKNLLWKLAGYAGWNTSSNTLGTCLAMGMIFDLYGDTQAHRNFLALRYLEDVGYDSSVRREIWEKGLPLPGFSPFHACGTHGLAARTIQEKLQKFATENLNDTAHTVLVMDCRLPWNRLFEADISVKVCNQTG